jgi:hypothetical protein
VKQTTRADNEVALAWLGNSLKYAHDRGQARLAALLASVRTEIAFEMGFATARRAPLLAARAAHGSERHTPTGSA